MSLSTFKLPTLLASLAVALLTARLVLVNSTSIEGATPSLRVAQPIIELGELLPGEVRRVAIPITNNGSRRLVLHKVNQECQCGDSPQSPLLIPPGATQNLVEPIEATVESGPFEQSINITTNDPAAPRVTFLVRGLIRSIRDNDEQPFKQRREVSVLKALPSNPMLNL